MHNQISHAPNATNWTGNGVGLSTLANMEHQNGTEPLAFVGIFSRQEDLLRRTLIRRTTMPLVPTEITVRFVICAITGSGSYHLLAEEHRQHDDIYILNCTENMNGGKSIHFFQKVIDEFPCHTYYGKADLDSYLVFPQLASALRSAPVNRFYGGRCNAAVQFNVYMSGAAYFVSSDAARALAKCTSECGTVHGPEDLIVAEHLSRAMQGNLSVGDLGRNRSLMYDRDDEQNAHLFSHVVFVHPLKTQEEWLRIHQRVTSHNEHDATDAEYWDGECSNRTILEPI
jgi:hypothetical protein